MSIKRLAFIVMLASCGDDRQHVVDAPSSDVAIADAGPDALVTTPPFGTNGIVNIMGLEFARDLIEVPGGRIVVAGDAGNDYGVTRLLADGSLDMTFGTAGITRITVSTSGADVFRVARQPSGALLVVGQHENPLVADIVRLTADGVLDTSFAAAGHLVISGGGSNNLQPFVVFVLADGSFYLAGHLQYQLWITRYSVDGVIDSSFGTSGSVVDPIFGGVGAVVVQTDGSIVAAENYNSGGAVRFVRFSSSGVVDTSFGTSGIASVTVGASNTEVADMAIGAAGSLFVGGSTTPSGGDSDLMAASVTSAGQPGLAQHTNIGSDAGGAMVLQPDGAIVVAGDTISNGTSTTLVRYLVNGTLDPTFGTAGVVRTPYASGGGEVGAMIRQPDGKLVVATLLGSNQYFTVARYKPDGTLDAP